MTNSNNEEQQKKTLEEKVFYLKFSTGCLKNKDVIVEQEKQQHELGLETIAAA